MPVVLVTVLFDDTMGGKKKESEQYCILLTTTLSRWEEARASQVEGAWQFWVVTCIWVVTARARAVLRSTEAKDKWVRSRFQISKFKISAFQHVLDGSWGYSGKHRIQSQNQSSFHSATVFFHDLGPKSQICFKNRGQTNRLISLYSLSFLVTASKLISHSLT